MFSLRHWQASRQWENWSGYVTATPEQKLSPSSVEALQEIIKQARIHKSGCGLPALHILLAAAPNLRRLRLACIICVA
nr:hypothetical protein [Psychrobacter sp. PraFG1]UNK06646.1 hypothetical protein MN210_07210 [Psychrobacter sp. PraFG1]